MTYNKANVFIEESNLERFGKNTARALCLNGSVASADIAREIISKLREIRDIHDRVQREVEKLSHLPEAYEWLLDNWYLAQREGVSAATELREAKRLRSVQNGGAMIVELASALVRSGLGDVAKERCEIFLTGFQQSRVLSRQELAIFVPSVKGALIDELCSLCKTLPRHGGDDSVGAAMGRVFGSLRLLSTLDLSTPWNASIRPNKSCSETPPISTGRWTSARATSTVGVCRNWQNSAASKNTASPNVC